MKGRENMKRVAVFSFLLFMFMCCVSYAATYMTLSAKEEIIKGDLLNDGHTYKIAFYDSSSTCSASFGDSYTATNLVGTAGGYEIGTSFTVGSSGTTAFLDDFSGEASNEITLSSQTFSAAADCGIIYNDTHASDEVLLIFDISPAIQPTAEDVTITFPTDDTTNAIIRLQ